jgi:hypothetical protein
VSLTADGRALRGRATDVPPQIAATTGLPPQQLASLRDTLIALTEAVTAADSRR